MNYKSLRAFRMSSVFHESTTAGPASPRPFCGPTWSAACGSRPDSQKPLTFGPSSDLAKMMHKLLEERDVLKRMVQETTPLDGLDDIDAVRVYYVNLAKSHEVREPSPSQTAPPVSAQGPAGCTQEDPSGAFARCSRFSQVRMSRRVDCQDRDFAVAASAHRYGALGAREGRAAPPNEP